MYLSICILNFQTITTPRKERYRLRNRTVIGESFTPDLNESIPFESPEKLNDEASPFDDNQDTLLEDANKALLEQIKQLQVTFCFTSFWRLSVCAVNIVQLQNIIVATKLTGPPPIGA